LRASRPWDASVPPVGHFCPPECPARGTLPPVLDNSTAFNYPNSASKINGLQGSVPPVGHLYRLWHGFGAVFSALQGVCPSAPRLFARGLRGRKLSGVSASASTGTARPAIRAGPKARKSSADARPILHPEEPLNEANRWEPNPGNSPQKGPSHD
jgi:hypothetical protein